MSITLKELDELWEGQNLDKANIKLLCRKYSPQVIMEWIARGLTIHNKDLLATWYKERLKEMGEEIMEKPPEVKDKRLFKEEVGDYFSD